MKKTADISKLDKHYKNYAFLVDNYIHGRNRKIQLFVEAKSKKEAVKLIKIKFGCDIKLTFDYSEEIYRYK